MPRPPFLLLCASQPSTEREKPRLQERRALLPTLPSHSGRGIIPQESHTHPEHMPVNTRTENAEGCRRSHRHGRLGRFSSACFHRVPSSTRLASWPWGPPSASPFSSAGRWSPTGCAGSSPGSSGGPSSLTRCLWRGPAPPRLRHGGDTGIRRRPRRRPAQDLTHSSLPG